VAITPTSNIARQIDALKTLIEASTTWQATTAASVYVYDVAGGEYTRPAAIICEGMDGQVRRGGFLSGGLTVLFERDPDPLAVSSYEEELSFRNWYGAILSEMRILAEGGGYLIIQDAGGMKVVQPPSRRSPQDESTYFQVWIALVVGLR